MSGKSGMLAFVTGLGSGYLQARDRGEEQLSRMEDRKWRKEERERQRKDWDKADKLDESLRAAGSPVAVKDATTYQPAVDDEGNDMPANPTQGRMSVLGTNYSDRASADAAAAKANTSQARATRMADAYDQAGMPDKASTMRMNSMQTEKAGLELDQARETKIDSDYNRDLMRRVGDFASLESFVNDSPGDGEGGAVKVKFLPSADGKTMQVVRLGEDGKQSPTQYQFQNDQTGLVTAMYMLSRGTSTKDKLAHLQSIAKDKVDADYKGGMLGIAKQNADTAQQNANTNEQWRRDQVDVQRDKVNATRKDPLAKMPEHVKIQYQGLTKRVTDLEGEISKAELGGMADPAAIGRVKAQKATLQLQAQQLLRRYTDEAPADPLGLRTSPAAGGASDAPGGATRIDPKVQAARDKDRLSILQTELTTARQAVQNAADPTARARAVGDVAALEREIAGQQRRAPAARAEARMAAAPAAPGAAPAAPAPAAAPAQSPTALQAVESRIRANLEPLAQRVRQARAQMQAVAQSGDPRAAATYATELQSAMTALQTEAEKRLGNGAAQYLNSIAQ